MPIPAWSIVNEKLLKWTYDLSGPWAMWFTESTACAGMALVAKHGAEHTANMLAVFEGYLEAKDVADEASYDRVREGVVILLGTLAQHLDAEGPKVNPAFVSSLTWI